jgi:hypothetical protein
LQKKQSSRKTRMLLVKKKSKLSGLLPGSLLI